MSSKRTYKMSALSEAVQNVSSRAFRRYGFARKEILLRWPEIVGPALAECSAPERLSYSGSKDRGGVLHIRVEGSLALEIQHFEPIILERINGFYGYDAVEKLKLHTGPVFRTVRRRSKPKVITLKPEEKQHLEEKLKGIKDKKLYDVLFRLGSEIFYAPSNNQGENTDSPEVPRKRFGRRGRHNV